MQHSYSVRHECCQNRGGVFETFFEHSLIFAHNIREAQRIATHIPLDVRRRRLIHVVQVG